MTLSRRFGTYVASVVSLLILGGCPGSRTPGVPAATPLTVPISRDGGSLRGVAGDGTLTYAAITAETPSSTVLEARRGNAIVWTTVVAGSGGPLAITGGLLVATLTGTGPIGVRDPAAAAPAPATAQASSVHGEPGAVVVGLDAATGAARWRATLDASEWCVVSAIAAAPDGIIVGGSFAGSLRIGGRAVASGGRSDGFIAKLTTTGAIAWLVRVGGSGPDAVQGVAIRGPRVAIAGTFAAGADLLGHDLPAFDDKSPYADAFVAALDANGAVVWSSTFGGKLAETVAGVAIDDAGRVAVAANARVAAALTMVVPEALGSLLGGAHA